ncbi:site-2 protease family protein [Kiloniella laminariae]|uniref:Site-2 protease family protein n=1 Tax=Kiloniella laminariae TaxID=454162 RepID=A0ABT4LNG8_9PROT|nr:site-2 protease family protein [Kiloniella laminariae]MCZ4282633.1 site-2 protease family protein [Kiloniella laminariae]
MMDISTFLFGASVWALPVLFAVTLHEAAHAYVAYRLGDDTAYKLGRVTLNPLKHTDPFGTILLPAVLIFSGSPFILGWAKPVPVRFGRLGNPKRDMIFVALAGPLSNLFIALVAAIGIAIIGIIPDIATAWVLQNLRNAIVINLILAVFNMLPILPLDGGRVLTGLLPIPLAIKFSQTERFGMVILLVLIFALPFVGREFGMNLNIIGYIIGTAIDGARPFFEAIAGRNLF